MKRIIFTAILFTNFCVCAQGVPYKWENSSCRYESAFDSKKYTKTQIDNCITLYNSDYSLSNIPWFSETTDFEKLNLLDNEFKEKQEALKDLIIPNIQFWEDLKRARLRYMVELYEVARLNFLAMDKPRVLLAYKKENHTLQKYAKALTAGGDELTKVWLEYIKGQIENGEGADNLNDIKKEEIASKDKLLYAKKDIFVVWWNTAVSDIYRVGADPKFENEKCWKELQKLFIKKIKTESISLSDQEDQYTWEYEYCVHESAFDSKKYTETQMDNCRTLLYGQDCGLEKLAWIFEPTDFEKLDVSILDNEYNEKREALKNIALPNIKFWKDLQKARLRYMEELYEIGRLEYLAVDNPSVLLAYKKDNPTLQKYAKALTAGGDELIQAGIEFEKERIKEDKDKLLYAKILILAFGWWNTANHNIYWVNEDPAFKDEICWKEFQKLFIKKIKTECEE